MGISTNCLCVYDGVVLVTITLETAHEQFVTTIHASLLFLWRYNRLINDAEKKIFGTSTPSVSLTANDLQRSISDAFSWTKNVIFCLVWWHYLNHYLWITYLTSRCKFRVNLQMSSSSFAFVKPSLSLNVIWHITWRLLLGLPFWYHIVLGKSLQFIIRLGTDRQIGLTLNSLRPSDAYMRR